MMEKLVNVTVSLNVSLGSVMELFWPVVILKIG